jgi:beta-glucosidase
MKKILRFPKDFLWGSSVSAYQVEGGIENCDWSKFESSGIACDHYNRYEEDFDLVKNFNQNAFRFSLEWSRIEPEEGKFDKKEIEHYKKVLLALKKRNIKSVVTLWHWTNPLWLVEKGGWSDKKIVYFFSRYTKFVVEELGDLIDFWVTLNEPLVHISNGYLQGIFPPNKKDVVLAIKTFRNLVKSHQEAFGVIHQKYPQAKVSIAAISNFFKPARKWFLLERFFAFLLHYFWNQLFLKKIRKYIDYVGVDYYFAHQIVFYPPFLKKFGQSLSDIGWEIYPEGIYWVLKNLSKFKKPIYILENGLADSKDRFRENFIRDHLFWIYKAIEEGIDIRGYFHWSLIDNFEWDRGFFPRFGLIEINYQDLERKPRPSAFYYAKICKENYLEIDS